MRRLVPALLGLAILGSCARQHALDTVAPGASPEEIALGPVGVHGTRAQGAATDDTVLPLALLRGMWERRVNGGRVRYSLDNSVIRVAVIEERTGKEAFFVQGQWKIEGRNVLICEETDASLAADARLVPELDGAGVVRWHSWYEGAPFMGTFVMEATPVGSFSFRMRAAGDGVIIDRFEGENFTDRAKRLFEGQYGREAP